MTVYNNFARFVKKMLNLFLLTY